MDKMTFMQAADKLNVLVFVSGPLQEVSKGGIIGAACMGSI
jgi:hypothetical protein